MTSLLQQLRGFPHITDDFAIAGDAIAHEWFFRVPLYYRLLKERVCLGQNDTSIFGFVPRLSLHNIPLINLLPVLVEVACGLTDFILVYIYLIPNCLNPFEFGKPRNLKNEPVARSFIPRSIIYFSHITSLYQAITNRQMSYPQLTEIWNNANRKASGDGK